MVCRLPFHDEYRQASEIKVSTRVLRARSPIPRFGQQILAASFAKLVYLVLRTVAAAPNYIFVFDGRSAIVDHRRRRRKIAYGRRPALLGIHGEGTPAWMRTLNNRAVNHEESVTPALNRNEMRQG
jgi:hypothetical protein